MRRVTFALLLCMALGGVARAQDLPGKKPGTDPDLQTPSSTAVQEPEADLSDADAAAVGGGAPGFVLDGSQGHPVRLADLKGHWVVLVFDDDRAKLARLQSIAGRVDTLGASLYGVSPDGVGALQELAAREKLSFTLLSDPTGDVSQIYGMFDSESGDPLPGLVLLDPKGVVRALWTGVSLHPDVVLQLVRHTIVGA
jgi:peroxiredoxin Q/BCP